MTKITHPLIEPLFCNLPRQSMQCCCISDGGNGNIHILSHTSKKPVNYSVQLAVKKLHRSESLISGKNRPPTCRVTALDGDSRIRQKQNPAVWRVWPRCDVSASACRRNPNGMSYRVNRNVNKLIKCPTSLNASACNLDLRLNISETVRHLTIRKRTILNALGFGQPMLAQKISEPLVSLLHHSGVNDCALNLFKVGQIHKSTRTPNVELNHGEETKL